MGWQGRNLVCIGSVLDLRWLGQFACAMVCTYGWLNAPGFPGVGLHCSSLSMCCSDLRSHVKRMRMQRQRAAKREVRAFTSNLFWRFAPTCRRAWEGAPTGCGAEAPKSFRVFVI